MENQLETGIISLNDADFNSLIMGGSPEPVNNEQPQTVESAVEQFNPPAQIPIQESHIAALESLDFDELTDVIEDKETLNQKPVAETEQVSEPTSGSLEESALQNIAEFFIEKGVWDDFEGRDEFDFKNQEAVADLLIKQTEKKANDYLSNLVEKTGPYGKAIIDYVENGGNPDDLIDLFKEEKAVVNTDVSSDQGKRDFIQNYYVNVANMKPDRAKKVVEALELEGELDNELNDVRGQYEEYYRQERVAIENNAKEETRIRKENEQYFRNDVINEVSKRSDLTDKQRRQLAESVLVDDYELPDGSRTTKLHASLSKVRNNMTDYLEFVEFVTDKENYKKRLITQTKNQGKVETFNFLKGNNNSAKKTGSTRALPEQKESTFKFI